MELGDEENLNDLSKSTDSLDEKLNQSKKDETEDNQETLNRIQAKVPKIDEYKEKINGFRSP